MRHILAKVHSSAGLRSSAIINTAAKFLAGMVFSTFILVAAPLYSSSAQAQTCRPHNELVAKLGSRFKEKRRAFGLINETRMMEVFVSKAGTWTMLVTTTDKISCVVAAGESWEQWKVLFDPAA